MGNGDPEGEVTFPKSQQVSRRTRTRTSVFLLNYTMKKKLFFDLKSDYSLWKMLYLHLTFVNIKKFWNAELLWQCCVVIGKVFVGYTGLMFLVYVPQVSTRGKRLLLNTTDNLLSRSAGTTDFWVVLKHESRRDFITIYKNSGWITKQHCGFKLNSESQFFFLVKKKN